MKTCPIASAAKYIEQTWKSIDRLADGVDTALNEKSINCKFRSSLDHPDDYSGIRVGYQYALTGVYPRQRKNNPAQLLLYFDLWREQSDAAGTLDQALLCVAYAQSFTVGWELKSLFLNTNGDYLDSDSNEYIRSAKGSRDKLLYWNEGNTPSDWRREAWMFFIDLQKITSLENMEKQIVDPIKALLIPEISQEFQETFSNADAIVSRVKHGS